MERFELQRGCVIFDKDLNNLYYPTVSEEDVYKLYKLLNELHSIKEFCKKHNLKLRNELGNLLNLCDDYNLTLDDIYTIVEESIESERGGV